MTITYRTGPLPDGHPLKGTHIFFGKKQPKPLEKNSTEEELQSSPEELHGPPDEEQLRMSDLYEQGLTELRDKLVLNPESTTANKNEQS